MGVDNMEKNQLLTKQLRGIEKLEQQFLNRKENTFIKDKINPVMDKIQNKIPEKLKSTLETAFYKGFQFIFEKGNTYIEKTYNKEKMQLDHDLNNYALDKYSSKRHLKNMDKQTYQSNAFNQSFAVLEGVGLGLLGIGLLDIPLFLSVIIKTINEVALTYGYSYDTEEEKSYLLYVICGAMTKEEIQKEYNDKIDLLGRKIDSNINLDTKNSNLEEIIKETSDLLSTTLLATKFVQGIPLIGAIGGAVNPAIINKIGRYAKIKYKKRYLLKKLND